MKADETGVAAADEKKQGSVFRNRCKRTFDADLSDKARSCDGNFNNFMAKMCMCNPGSFTTIFTRLKVRSPPFPRPGAGAPPI